MRRPLYAACAALCLLLTLVFALCFTASRMGRDADLYARCFHAFADTAHLGVSEAEYDGIARSLADYFQGGEADLSLFNERESIHLADIRGLFRLFDRAWLLLIPAFILAALLWKRWDRKGFLLGFGLCLALLAALAAYAAANFDSAFILMHRLLFTNELWLLSPRTDLLICLMPGPMFTFLAARWALSALLLWLVLPTAMIAAGLRRGKRPLWKAR